MIPVERPNGIEVLAWHAKITAKRLCPGSGVPSIFTILGALTEAAS